MSFPNFKGHLLKDDKKLPTYEDILNIKKEKGVPNEAAWIWGKDDELGRVNLLSPDRVLWAKKEIETGTVVSLNWNILLPEDPSYGRQSLRLKILKDTTSGLPVYDEMNPQSGTQLDGFRHFGYQGLDVFYNGITAADIDGPGTKGGVHAVSLHGIAGRAVLLDFANWADATGLSFSPNETRAITLKELLAVAKFQKTEFHVGDILLIRTGWIKAYETVHAADPEKVKGKHVPSHIGLAQDEDIRIWLHNQYFSLVGGDAPSFEVWPIDKNSPHYLHEYLLACWGVMIGEMIDLERLSVAAKAAGKYSFFFTSAPFNSPGGVSTLANALAIL